jgi:hypothetical protein
MKTSHNLSNDMHAHDSLIVLAEAYRLFCYYEAYPLFRYYVHALCFAIQTLYSYSLQIKYNKPINMQFYHYTLHNLNPDRSTHSNTLNQFNTLHSLIIS